MIQEIVLSTVQDLLLNSGFDDVESIRTATIKIRKPDKSTLSKSLTDDDFYPKTNKIRVPITSDLDLNQEGIYDYQIIDTTTPLNRIGKLLQFSVRVKL